jgi:hypothetical protein
MKSCYYPSVAFRAEFRHFRNHSILFERSRPSFPPRRSRRVTHFCLPKVDHIENTFLGAVVQASPLRGYERSLLHRVFHAFQDLR